MWCACVCACVCTCACGLTVCQVARCRLIGGRLGRSECRQALVLRVEGLGRGRAILLVTIRIHVTLPLTIVWHHTPDGRMGREGGVRRVGREGGVRGVGREGGVRRGWGGRVRMDG